MAKPNNHNPLTKTSQTINNIASHAMQLFSTKDYQAYMTELDENIERILRLEFKVLHLTDEQDKMMEKEITEGIDFDDCKVI
jgi:hypothetical protein